MDKKNILIFSVALSVVLLDQLTKIIVRNNFKPGESLPLINNVLHFTYVTNTGSAFGLFKGFNIFLIVFSIVVIIGIFYYLKKIVKSKKLLQFAAGLLLGGTIGNLMDRLSYGAVTDFIDFRIWPVFNMADSAVTISVAMLVFMLWKE